MPPRTIPVAPEQIVELGIEATGDNGDGLGKVGGYVVFVPGALAGERVRARITSASGKHGRGELLDVLVAAPDRIVAHCRHFGACGGCQLQHVAYPAQLQLKRARLQKTLRHTLRRDIEVAELAAPQSPWGQRSKVVLHVERRPSGYCAGLYGRRSRKLVPLDQCPAADDAAFALARRVLEACERLRVPAWDVRYGDGALRGVLVRATSTGQLGVVLISAVDPLANEHAVVEAIAALGAASVWINHLPAPPRQEPVRPGSPLPLRADAFEPSQLLGPKTRCVHGDDFLVEELAGVRYLVSATTFFQTSRFGAECLLQTVLALAEPLAGKTVVDAYCGGGLFALAMAKRGARVIGVEDDDQAVADAERSARANGSTGVRFVAGAAQRALRSLAAEKPDLVILDPPRSGCHAGVIETVTQVLQPAQVIYVACDVDALARDAAAFEQLEYALERVQPLDMFPFTHHLETVARFARNPQVRGGRKRFSRAAGERLLAKARVGTEPEPPPAPAAGPVSDADQTGQPVAGEGRGTI